MTVWQDFGFCLDDENFSDMPEDIFAVVGAEGETTEFKVGDPDHPHPAKRSTLYYFFEGYEESKYIAAQTDSICFECPVQRQCLEFGVEQKSTGVYGGAYLSKGNIDFGRNSHKTTEQWQTLKDFIDAD